jgi:hypothetical protein
LRFFIGLGETTVSDKPLKCRLKGLHVDRQLVE